MLVLSRKNQESIHIGDDIVITIVGMRDGKVRLGIEAPKGIPVHRTEIYHLIKRQEAEQCKSTNNQQNPNQENPTQAESSS